ncbi:carbohydrate kinase family protein [Deinococcus sp. UYEF24]
MYSGAVLVAGGINADVLGRTLAAPSLYTSNPALAGVTPGGVARNISEHLARLLPTGLPVKLLGAVGTDPLGAGVLEATAAAGVDVSGVLRLAGQTGMYLAVLDHQGELHIGLAAMTLTDSLTPEVTADWNAQVAGAALLVLDANLPAETASGLLRTARESGVRAVLEPVSAPKAARLWAELRTQPLDLFLVKPDRAELEAMTGQADPSLAAQMLLDQGVQNVLLTLGAAGSVLYRAGQPPIQTAAPQTSVLDVTGAGDSLVAGLCAALARGLSLPEAVKVGHACAALTVASAQTVPEELNWEAVAGGGLVARGL